MRVHTTTRIHKSSHYRGSLEFTLQRSTRIHTTRVHESSHYKGPREITPPQGSTRVHTAKVHESSHYKGPLETTLQGSTRVYTTRVHERSHWKQPMDIPRFSLFEAWELCILCVPQETKVTHCPFQRGMETIFSVKAKDFDFQSEINLVYQDQDVLVIIIL